MDQTDRAIERLSQLAQRVIELALRLKTDRMRAARRRDDGVDVLAPLATVAPGDEFAEPVK